MLLLDDGLSCEAVARVLYLDDDTVRGWHERFRREVMEATASVVGEAVPCGAACGDDGVVAVEDADREPVASEELPDVSTGFNWGA